MLAPYFYYNTLLLKAWCLVTCYAATVGVDKLLQVVVTDEPEVLLRWLWILRCVLLHGIYHLLGNGESLVAVIINNLVANYQEAPLLEEVGQVLLRYVATYLHEVDLACSVILWDVV